MNKKNCKIGCPDCEEICKTKANNSPQNIEFKKMEPVYTCAICGKEYNTVVDRVKCELKCIKEQEEFEEKRKQNMLKQQHESRLEALNTAYSAFVKLRDEYLEDYGFWSFTF